MSARRTATRDVFAGLAVLAILTVGWLSLFNTFDLVAGLGLLALMVMPFAILVTALVREVRKPPRSAPGEKRSDDS